MNKRLCKYLVFFSVLLLSPFAFGTLYLSAIEEHVVGHANVDNYFGSWSYANLDLEFKDSSSPPSWVTLGYQSKSNDSSVKTMIGSYIEDRTSAGCGYMSTWAASWRKNTSGWQSAHGGTCPPSSTGYTIGELSADNIVDSCDWNMSDLGSLGQPLVLTHSNASNYLPGSGWPIYWAYAVKAGAYYLDWASPPNSNSAGDDYTCFHLAWNCNN